MIIFCTYKLFQLIDWVQIVISRIITLNKKKTLSGADRGTGNMKIYAMIIYQQKTINGI